MRSDAHRARILGAISIAILVAATALRVWNFASGRSLWHDETLVALNIIHQPLTALLAKLHFNQIAPAGWLALEKLSYWLWPSADYSLRVVSLIGGIAAVFAVWRLSYRLLAPREALLALAMFGLTTSCIRYSAMVKPYILDALFSALVLLIGSRLLTEPEGRAKRMLLLAMAGIACILLTFSGLFVLASTGVVLFAGALVARNWRWAAGLASVGLVWIAALLGTYALSYAQESTMGRMAVYWADAFAPLPTTLEALSWYPRKGLRLLAFFDDSYARRSWVAAVVGLCALIGSIAFILRRSWLAALLLGPFAVALAASAAHLYPLEGRLWLSLAPPTFVLAAHGAGRLAAAARYRTAVFAVLIAVLLGGPLLRTASDATERPAWPLEEVKPNLYRLARDRGPEDVILVTWAAEQALLLYAREVGLSGMAYRATAYLWEDSRCILRDLAALPSGRRAWLLIYHEQGEEPSAIALLQNEVNARGEVSLAGDEKGSQLYRIELWSPIPPSPVAPLCLTPRKHLAFLHEIARREGLAPQTPTGESEIP